SFLWDCRRLTTRAGPFRRAFQDTARGPGTSVADATEFLLLLRLARSDAGALRLAFELGDALALLLSLLLRGAVAFERAKRDAGLRIGAAVHGRDIVEDHVLHRASRQVAAAVIPLLPRGLEREAHLVDHLPAHFRHKPLDVRVFRVEHGADVQPPIILAQPQVAR